MGNGERFTGRSNGRGMKLTINFSPVSKSKMAELYLHSPICLHGILLNLLITGKFVTLPWRIYELLATKDVTQGMFQQLFLIKMMVMMMMMMMNLVFH
jgi:hypothetical protein